MREMQMLKTTILLAALTGLIMGVGYLLGGKDGTMIALALAAVMNFVSFWYSDKIVLAMYRAKAITANEFPKLHAIIEELARAAGIPKPKLYLVELPVPNAFATGRSPEHAAVAVTHGILELLSEEELRGVLAHELSHVVHRDILVSSIAATLAGAISYIAQFAYFGALGGRSRENRGGGAGALVLLILTPIIATFLHLAVSRSREYFADETGAHISKKPRALAEALKKLHQYSRARPLLAAPKYESTAHLFIVNPFKPSLLASLFSTHPPIEERVKRLEAMRA